jgi:hypothetical protein
MQAIPLQAILLQAILLQAILPQAILLQAILLQAILLQAILLQAILLQAILPQAILLQAILLQAILLQAILQVGRILFPCGRPSVSPWERANDGQQACNQTGKKMGLAAHSPPAPGGDDCPGCTVGHPGETTPARSDGGLDE